MRNQITILLGLTLFTSFGLAQSFTITLFPGTLLSEGGVTVDHSVQDNLGINIFFAETSTTSSEYSTIFSDPTQVDAGAFSSLGGLNWGSITQTASGGNQFWTSPGWSGGSGSAVSATAGNTVLVAFTTGQTVGSTVGGDSVALLASNIVVGALGQTNMQFGTQFDVIAGIDGSVQMVSAVPEPSSFAALAGLMTLGFVAMRRRRA